MWNNTTGTFISTNQLNNLNTIFFTFFNTFQRNIIIYKESTQVPTSTINTSIGSFGFGGNQIISKPNYNYIQVTGIYPALINYPNDQKQELIEDANVQTTPGDVVIKVKEDAVNFIENGKTVKIVIDSRSFEIIGEKRQKTLLNSVLFAYVLQSIDL